ncbi:Snf7-domain-containing protein [Russula earlei]|uniref:Snf7-domain-containing protein n=1 Tax=Russula earlei TaxID=71964 RepID=A0ACC0U9N2_9AGAM|nr:Snf7-domain-containing protein [Russula earlei]
MSSSPLSSLPSFSGLSDLRIQSLYSDIAMQKHSKPTTYHSNVAWWRSTLEAIVSCGWLSNTPDRLILHADRSVLEALRYEGIGKPGCLGTVVTELIDSRAAVHLQQFLSMSHPVHDPGWLPYRVLAFVVGSPLRWALHQLNLNGSDDSSDTERWSHIKGDYVLVGVVERAADAVLASQRTRGVSLADRLYTFDSFRATFAASALPGVTLSDKDLCVLIKFIERDRRAVVTEKEVIKFIDAGSSASEVTAVDRGVVELKTAIANLSAQIDRIAANIDSYKSKATAAIRQQHKSLALSYLRSRKQLEDVLSQRLGSLETLQGTLLRIEGSAEDIQIVKTYESSTAALRALLAHPSLQRDAVERTFDALADANADARELDEAVRSGMGVALGVGLSDDKEIEGELAALEAEAKAETRAEEKPRQHLELEVTHHESAAEHDRERASMRTRSEPDYRPESEPILIE